MTLVLQFLLLAFGFLLLVKGADWFVEGASGIADKFGIPQLVIGLTIVAMGTSAPETAVSITAALKGNADVAVGNVLGSNILNVLIILGISAVITSIAIAKTTIRYEIPIMLGATFLLLGFGATGGSINLWEGIAFLGCFVLYLLYMFVMVKKGEMQAEQIDTPPIPLWRLLLMMVVGLGLIVWGSDITIDAATQIAKIAGLSEQFIGLTIVALGTSLPELVTSVVAAKKGKADIAIGNIVGSNIFNLLFVLGISACIIPVVFDYSFVKDCLIAAGAGIVLWVCVFPKKKLTRLGGGVLLLCYAAYFAYLLIL